MNIENILLDALPGAIQTLFGATVENDQLQLQKTRKDFEGDLTLVVFPLVRIAKKSPEETGRIIGEFLVENIAEVEAFNVVKGFLNLTVADSYWTNFYNDVLNDVRFGFSEPKSKDQLMVEYSSPNTNKPLHLGHLRNNFLGYSVSQILEANGHDVIRVQIINDRGIHICKSMLAWQKFGNGETPEGSGLKGDKLVGKYYVLFDQHYKAQIKELMDGGMSEDEAKEEAPLIKEAREMLRKWEQKDPEVYALWEKMNQWVYKGFDATYEAMGVSFDKLYYESDTYLVGRDEVLNGLEKGIFFKKEDGSVWCDLTEDGLDQKLVLRKDGTAVYMTQDIGTAILRFKDFPKLAGQIYTVGNEQEYHFKVLFLILKKLGFGDADKNSHLSYGMVELPEGKMKSREGTVVDADDIMQEMENSAREIAHEQGKLEGLSPEEEKDIFRVVGMAALKYFLLRVDPKKNMMFDPRESIDFNGNTGPFIQYGYVRTRALLRKAGVEAVNASPKNTPLEETEKRIIKKVHDFPEVLKQAGDELNPAVLASYAYELVKDYNSFYQSVPVLREENDELKNFRLGLSYLAGNTIKNAMETLGIQMPERM